MGKEASYKRVLSRQLGLLKLANRIKVAGCSNVSPTPHFPAFRVR
jgi:hypothetical protein